MAIKYAINTGALTWTGASWNTASNQAVSNTTAPTTSDTATLDQYSSNMTINTGTCVCQNLNMTGYTNTLTFTSSQNLTIGTNGQSNTVTLGGTIAGTGTLTTTNGLKTITSNGVVMTGNFTANGSSVPTQITLSGDFQVNGTFSYTSNLAINGSKLKFNGATWTIGSKATLTGTGTVEFLSTLTLPPVFAINVIFNSGANTLTFPATTSFSKIVTYTSGTCNFSTNSNVSTFSTGSSVNTSGITFLTVLVAGTVTMLANFNCTNLVFDNVLTILGAYTLTTDKVRGGSSATLSITSSVTYTFDTAMTLVISSYMYLAGNYPFTLSFLSNSSGTPTNWTYNGTLANCQIANCAFTDISSSTRIYSLNSPVIRSPNVLQIRNSDTGGGGLTLTTT